MNMKKFVKKPLAIAVLMLASSGVVNMVHADSVVRGQDLSTSVIHQQDVSASKEVKGGGSFKIEFTASPDEIIAGKQEKDVTVFILKVSDSARHNAWDLAGTGSSVGGYMFDSAGNRIGLHSSDWKWDGSTQTWHKDDSGSAELEERLFVAKGETLNPGKYTFTGYVSELLV
ncbi:TPA: MyfA/PsaA family fimbrial adhesin [Yersinia enterocolitica]|uniref:MyfA/PsaA family fimbrial adhesin n=1 Tax=Yersinia enterocolitica TaxID=630 RepID=UPI0002DDC146|nr:MyfA/PsaA family fimbrial adhesin [Yersinia enterocolitica]HEF7268650.1 MyfA/PsaA family fimbrial adhesin [Yersinia enterocolitica]HEI6722767.1 MyfA/PsaA family fimbrial adhesin [Yersinia enterocolitica]HEI6758684.1 MyfA/PsaA family fimbrial adhesin [Yersinia enterocolitica]HEI6823861.1 MyfA/PsaA family fimbrial adhesin [Yersinia enterocolitica]HEI6865997.1 MyfA/PsaA family fimbrial adhesin [Yersinia enterocolitica]